MFVGGLFTTAGGGSAKGIARWDGQTWYPLGAGVNPVNTTAGVEALASGLGGELYVAGDFIQAGLKPSSYFGVWHASAPATFITGLSVTSGSTIVLNWPSTPTGVYQVHHTLNLSQPFAPLGSLVPSAGALTTFTNNLSGESAHFFRIQQVQP